jgi:hypothetical protein
MSDILRNKTRGPAKALLLLAHGAGAGMDSPSLSAMSGLLAARNVACLRFEFAYMAARRQDGRRRPPPRMDRLADEFRAAVRMADRRNRSGIPLLIGGKSMGGRVASLIADELFAAGRIAGLACLGYPFHPPRKPEKLRTAHLEALTCPTLIVQGTRDALGNRADVAGYTLAPTIQLTWIADGDHDLVPRKRSGRSAEDAWSEAADAISDFAKTV